MPRRKSFDGLAPKRRRAVLTASASTAAVEDSTGQDDAGSELGHSHQRQAGPLIISVLQFVAVYLLYRSVQTTPQPARR